jgi:uncharacterized protein YqeY
MSLLQKIKADQLQFRKGRRTAEATLLTTLIGEAEQIGKNDGNRDTTDAEMTALITKFVKNQREVIKYIDNSEAPATLIAEDEIKLLSTYLPQSATREQIVAAIETIKGQFPDAQMGVLMKYLKAWCQEHTIGLDGALASSIIKELQ